MASEGKKTMLISFSGGETSAFMLQWLLKHKKDEFNFIIVFANTGRENNETLDFVKKVGEFFNVEIVWVESKIGGRVDKGTHHTIVSYETATRKNDWKLRDNTPYEEMIKKYGIPNIENRFSTRELKDKAITSYMRSIGFKNKTYITTIGIRVDEFDRMSKSAKQRGFSYPLISWKPTTKKHVNFYWAQMPFRLELKGYWGNCVDCYKKYLHKLYAIAKGDPKNLSLRKQWSISMNIICQKVEEKHLKRKANQYRHHLIGFIEKRKAQMIYLKLLKLGQKK
jgi:predicted phosphoadenosine phosphosulfate sulfurtransferase